MRFIIIAFVAVAGFLALPLISHAQKDTTSSSDVQFTSIPTAADSIAMRKQMAATLAKTKEALKQAQTANENAAKLSSNEPKSLWAIFLAGLIGYYNMLFSTDDND